MNDGDLINSTYGLPDLLARIDAGLRAAGKDPAHPAAKDLALVDQFHSRGRESTRELCDAAGLQAGERVVDAGGGLGGPARFLAHERGCFVTVVDITREFCTVGTELTRRVGLSDRVTFQCGSALAMTAADGSFDVGWTQHSTMNIADKTGLFAELHRVIRRGGRLAMHEIIAGPQAPLLFPVPWARDPAISHLIDADAFKAALQGAGFVLKTFVDETDTTLSFFKNRVGGTSAGGLPPLGAHVLLGADAPALYATMVRNFSEGRARVVKAILERP